MTRSWFHATDDDGNEVTSILLSFAEQIGLSAVAHDRYSILLLLELFGGAQSGTLNPAKVVSQIEALEGVGVGGGLKPATPFKHPPLNGLWHQHYLEDGLPSMARNLSKGIDRFVLPWLKRQATEADAAGEEKSLTEADCARIAHEAVVSNWQQLIETTALTGEWIVFAKHQGKNYYLSLGKHDSGDEVLRARIDAICLSEFPFLKDILVGL